MFDREEHLKAIVKVIADKTGRQVCNCRRAFERDCRRGGCGPAEMNSAEIVASYIKVEDVR